MGRNQRFLPFSSYYLHTEAAFWNIKSGFQSKASYPHAHSQLSIPLDLYSTCFHGAASTKHVFSHSFLHEHHWGYGLSRKCDLRFANWVRGQGRKHREGQRAGHSHTGT